MSIAGNDLCISYCTSQFSFEIKLAVSFTKLLDNIMYDSFAFTVVFGKISTPYITLGVVEMRSGHPNDCVTTSETWSHTLKSWVLMYQSFSAVTIILLPSPPSRGC